GLKVGSMVPVTSQFLKKRNRRSTGSSPQTHPGCSKMTTPVRTLRKWRPCGRRKTLNVAFWLGGQRRFVRIRCSIPRNSTTCGRSSGSGESRAIWSLPRNSFRKK
ncbi:hypothetical protein FOL46_004320, partial [Perkinsus olseni]